MNICFRVKDAVTEKEILEGAEARKLLGLKGHRVGIFRIHIFSSEPSFESKTCLGSVHSLDMVLKLAILPQRGNTDSEIVIQSVGGIRCVDSVFLTFADWQANGWMTQGKQLQCSMSVFSPQALPSRVVYVEQDNCRRKKVRRHISQLLSDPKRDLLTPNYRYPSPTCRSWQSIGPIFPVGTVARQCFLKPIDMKSRFQHRLLISVLHIGIDWPSSLFSSAVTLRGFAWSVSYPRDSRHNANSIWFWWIICPGTTHLHLDCQHLDTARI